MPVDYLGVLVEKVITGSPLNKALNAAGAHVPWRDILDAYAQEWGISVNYDKKIRIMDYLKYSDPGLQMAVYYSSRGAHFPDTELRKITGINGQADWKKTVGESVKALGNV
jgi:hypothetical protein